MTDQEMWEVEAQKERELKETIKDEPIIESTEEVEEIEDVVENVVEEVESIEVKKPVKKVVRKAKK